MDHLKPSHSLLFYSFFAFVNLMLSISAELDYLNQGWSISVERSDNVIVSPDRTFSAGFQSVGDNAYCFAVWFTHVKFTPVWMANRDYPVNGRRSALSLQKDGNVVLRDAARSTVWETGTTSASGVRLCLLDTGNLILHQTSTNNTLWQSFNFPTDTLLPTQQLRRDIKLIASRSQGNYSSGFYNFYFDNDNILRLLYNGPDISSIYWPNPAYVSWEVGRSMYNSSRTAVFDLSGRFRSSDSLRFFASDSGRGPKRRLTMDRDGNLRLYSLDEKKRTWTISWQAISNQCGINGICGPNSICVYEQSLRSCSCPPGFKSKDPTDLSQGCQPTFNLSCNPLESLFIPIPNTEFYGYDFNYTEGLTLQGCMNICLELCSCKAFMYKFDGIGQCYPKTMLLNGYQSSSFSGMMHIKLPRNRTISEGGRVRLETTHCNPEAHVELSRTYESKQENNSLKYILWFVVSIGGMELICIVMGWWYMYKNKGPSAAEKGFVIAATGFKRFSYAELKAATRNFNEVIGRGGGGVVYKGELPDERVVAVKRLEGVYQGEEEFLAEVSIIGRINHMNLIQVWGFCAERRHRLLVYEYMDRGSLAANLSAHVLDWKKRFEIAVGTAKGLAYLHEECLEWVLHCDVKPQNILLDAHYHPKVADFGLSKLRDRNSLNDSSFSRVRGTRGYMAPEWILNQPITSKVDVYSYGIVLLEAVTGRSSLGFNADNETIVNNEGRGKGFHNLVTWVRDIMCAADAREGRIQEIMDPMIDHTDDDLVKMELLVMVALHCVEEDRDARPTVRQVVEMLLHDENNS
ncbi:putative receptor protein kinase ZmPK1 [Cinnamomum micranthum f. kanehirae]|uniref:Receptor-like serine/threonine-protein kinase n=1 Tax=Cinnamomum micranthum f. kanehirae TaxID=337451 RepID=A0A3S4PKF1_9MAGN|nr:putative receptor protein kinase ZmPK1 [Cinnamomum micranthum f. kanehirae]